MVSVRVVLCIVALTPAMRYAEAASPADPDPNRFAKQIETFTEWDSRNAVPANPVLFVGSSSIRLWRTHEAFPDLPVVNRGFGGSHISEVIHFSDRVVLPYKAQVIVFYAGDNDVAGGKSAQRVFEDYRRFVGLVHAAKPDTCLVFLPIKPSRARWTLWPTMAKANELIRDWCKRDKRLFFADLATPLLGSDGMPRRELFLKDQLHLSPDGYAVWNRALAPVLEETLASPR